MRKLIAFAHLSLDGVMQDPAESTKIGCNGFDRGAGPGSFPTRGPRQPFSPRLAHRTSRMTCSSAAVSFVKISPNPLIPVDRGGGPQLRAIPKMKLSFSLRLSNSYQYFLSCHPERRQSRRESTLRLRGASVTWTGLHIVQAAVRGFFRCFRTPDCRTVLRRAFALLRMTKLGVNYATASTFSLSDRTAFLPRNFTSAAFTSSA